MKYNRAWSQLRHQRRLAGPAAIDKTIFERFEKFGAPLCCLIIFISDTFTVADGLASTLYILILVWLAERGQQRAILITSMLCIPATAATYVLAHGFVLHPCSVFRHLVSCAAIIVATPVALNIVNSRDALSEQDKFLDMTNHPIIGRDENGVIIYWNGAAERLYGWSKHEAIGQNFCDLLLTEFSSSQSDIQNQLERYGCWEGQLINKSRNGEKHTVLSQWFSQPDRNHNPGILDIAVDMTLLYQATERLRLSEARYRSIFNTVRIGLWEADYSIVAARIAALKDQGVTNFAEYFAATPSFVHECIQNIRLLDINETALTIFDASSKKDILESLKKITLLQSTSDFFLKVIEAIANGAACCTVSTSVQSLQGRTLSVLMTTNLPNSLGRMDSVLTSIVDDTARRTVQEAVSEVHESLLHVNQLTALGDMTATIAHQVNHPLAAIIANSEACLRWMNRDAPDTREAIQAMESVIRNGISATTIVTHIRALGTPQSAQKSPFSILEVIDDVYKLLERELTRQHIRLVRDFSRNVRPILGDRIRIEQVVLNLITNAIDALSTRPNSREIVISVAAPNDENILVRVKDNGTGIDPGVIDKLFSPFFTTKASGTGLGLSICKSFIASQNGKLWAANGPEQGAIFQFTLPCSPPDIQIDA